MDTACSHNWTTWILLMIGLWCPTPNSRTDQYCAEHSAGPRLIIRRGKGKILKVNSASTVSVTVGKEAIEDFHYVTYLDSVVDKQGGTEADI